MCLSGTHLSCIVALHQLSLPFAADGFNAYEILFKAYHSF